MYWSTGTGIMHACMSEWVYANLDLNTLELLGSTLGNHSQDPSRATLLGTLRHSGLLRIISPELHQGARKIYSVMIQEKEWKCSIDKKYPMWTLLSMAKIFSVIGCAIIIGPQLSDASDGFMQDFFQRFPHLPFGNLKSFKYLHDQGSMSVTDSLIPAKDDYPFRKYSNETDFALFHESWLCIVSWVELNGTLRKRDTS